MKLVKLLRTGFDKATSTLTFFGVNAIGREAEVSVRLDHPEHFATELPAYILSETGAAAVIFSEGKVSVSEHPVDDVTSVVVFTFPVAAGAAFRIAVSFDARDASRRAAVKAHFQQAFVEMGRADAPPKH